MNDNPAVIMEKVLSEHEVPEDKRVRLDKRKKYYVFYILN
jgi:hypothetical protein